MSPSDADEVWMAMAPLISLGYCEVELVEALIGLNLPNKVEAEEKKFEAGLKTKVRQGRGGKAPRESS